MQRWMLLGLLLFSISACIADDNRGEDGVLVSADDAGTSDTDATSDANSADSGGDAPPDATGADARDDGGHQGGSAVGGACSSESDCAHQPATCFADDDGYPGGYCAPEGCETNADCPDGSSCWRFQDDVSRCLDNCTTRSECRDGYYCDEDDVCWPGGCTAGSCAADEVCDEETGRCELAPCTPGSCDDGLVCREGSCVIDLGQPPQGPVPDCSATISWECDGTPEYCAEVVLFEPIEGDGWWNYPLNGESASNQYRSYLRRDTTQLIKYAAAKVACKAADWPGNGGLLGLGDMSEANGDIPGTSDGRPGHPAGTHVDGFDIDIAYFQQNTPDNKLRSVCDHHENNQDVYHCVSEPYDLDVWRTGLFLAHLHDAIIHNRFQMRVVGVDGRVGSLVESAIDQLCTSGWYSGPACDQSLIAYEQTDEGRGWYYFHHHHLHVSTNGLHPDVAPSGADIPADRACLQPGCKAD